MFGNKSHKKFYRVGGTRGGQDQFKWDDVKTDKYRENYLGNSLLAPVGRWQKGKDLTWYAKNSSDQKQIEAERIEEEKRRLKDLDDDLLNAALGIKTEKRKWTNSSQMDNDDLKYLLARGKLEREDPDTERVGGLGAGAMKFHEHIERKSFLAKEIEKLKKEVDGNKEENNEEQPNKKARYIPLDKPSTGSSSMEPGNTEQTQVKNESSDDDEDSSSSKSAHKSEKKHRKNKKEKKHKKHKKHKHHKEEKR